MARSGSRSSSLSSPALLQPTNTLAVTSLPKSFFNPLILGMLRDHFAMFGDINQWVPLQGFSRIIIVYESAHHAETAKQQCDPILVEDQIRGYVGLVDLDDTPLMTRSREDVVLRVYRADPNPLIPPGEQRHSWIPHSSYLRPPPVEKNFLISPPGSPPVGWEQIREDPPNSTPLADDLIAALKKLQTNEEVRTRPALEQLLDPMDGAGVGVYVEDYDANGGEFKMEFSEEDWVYGETAPARQKWTPIPTALPPLPSNFN